MLKRQQHKTLPAASSTARLATARPATAKAAATARPATATTAEPLIAMSTLCQVSRRSGAQTERNRCLKSPPHGLEDAVATAPPLHLQLEALQLRYSLRTYMLRDKYRLNPKAADRSTTRRSKEPPAEKQSWCADASPRRQSHNYIHQAARAQRGLYNTGEWNTHQLELQKSHATASNLRQAPVDRKIGCPRKGVKRSTAWESTCAIWASRRESSKASNHVD